MKAKRCAYCGCGFGEEGVKRTAEHIFPKGLLDLYPNEDISFTPERVFIDNSGLTIADVCDKCNNGPLSELDDYGIKLIKKYFFDLIDIEHKDDAQKVVVIPNQLFRWLLKIIYNYERSRKKDCTWFQQILPYVLENEKIDMTLFDFFMGVHVNNTPLPEHMYGFMPLEISENIKLFDSSIRYNIVMGIDDEPKEFYIEGTYDRISIRLGNAIFLAILWNKDVNTDIKNKLICDIKDNFDFVHLEHNKTDYDLKSVSCSTNLFLRYGHFLSNRAIKMDEMAVRVSLNGQDIEKVRKKIENMRTPDAIVKGQLLVKASMFPDNKKVKKEYKSVFGEEI